LLEDRSAPFSGILSGQTGELYDGDNPAILDEIAVHCSQKRRERPRRPVEKGPARRPPARGRAGCRTPPVRPPDALVECGVRHSDQKRILAACLAPLGQTPDRARHRSHTCFAVTPLGEIRKPAPVLIGINLSAGCARSTVAEAIRALEGGPQLCRAGGAGKAQSDQRLTDSCRMPVASAFGRVRLRGELVERGRGRGRADGRAGRRRAGGRGRGRGSSAILAS
jgi:hypothetical protein